MEKRVKVNFRAVEYDSNIIGKRYRTVRGDKETGGSLAALLGAFVGEALAPRNSCRGIAMGFSSRASTVLAKVSCIPTPRI